MSKRLKTVASKGKSKGKGLESSSRDRDSSSSPPPAPRPSSIVCPSAQQRERYEHLETLTPYGNRKIDWGFLNSVGLGQYLNEVIVKLKWERFLALDLPAYYEIALEFLSSVKRTETHLRYRLFNKPRIVSIKAISDLFHLPHEGNAVIAKEFAANVFWRRLTHLNEDFKGGKSCASKIVSPQMKLFHRLLSHTLHFRVEANDTVQRDDLYVMWCFHNNFLFDHTTWFIERILQLATQGKKNMPGCGYICYMALGHLNPSEINLSGLTPIPFRKSDLIGIDSFKGLKLIESKGQSVDGRANWVSTVTSADFDGAILGDNEIHQLVFGDGLKRKRPVPSASSSADSEDDTSPLPGGSSSIPSDDVAAPSLEVLSSRLSDLELTQKAHFERFQIFERRHIAFEDDMRRMMTRMHDHMFPPPPPADP